jgi:hypothetical protein
LLLGEERKSYRFGSIHNNNSDFCYPWPMSAEKSIGIPVAKDGVGDTRYVGFCDILGFSNRILTDFDRTLEVYRQFGSALSSLPVEGVTVTMYSDALLITGDSLGRVASAIQSLWFVALTHDLMIRGAITKGRYWEERQGNHMMVASDALVRAVKLEGSIGIPAVFVLAYSCSLL